ncbi:MAG TPA: nicotinate-nucleotide adenylyltransferase [bacterium]|nr:nicotinate-nucleotide adenylyltransferase [bacterium]
MKVCIFGGTFNPIHTGHLIMAQAALDAYGLDKVVFVPCYLPPHKGAGGVTPAADRLAMVKAAVAGNKRFGISDIEIARGGRSYSIDTVRAFRTRMAPADKLFFLIGSDSMRDFHTWVAADELLKLCAFIVYERPGAPVRTSRRAGAAQRAMHLICEVPIGISSTEIREKVRRGESVRHLVPPAVERYIAKKSLYRR